MMMMMTMMVVAEEEKDYDGGHRNLTFCQEERENTAVWYQNYVNFSQEMYSGDTSVWKTLGYVDCIKLFACIVIVIGGLLGNISVILTVAFRKSMRTTINIYIANLAVADAMTCVTSVVPFALHGMTNRVYVLGEFICKTETFVQILCLTSSVLSLAVISYDRFVAVIFPLRVRVTKQRPWLLIMFVWIASIAVATPNIIVALYSTVKWKNFLQTTCFETWPIEWSYDELFKDCVARRPLATAYYAVLTVALFFLPLLAMLIAYSFIIWKLWTRKAPGEQQAAKFNADSRSGKKVHKMIFVVLLTFIICWTPFQAMLFHFIVLSKRTENFQYPEWFPTFRWSCEYMAYANSLLNPIIYGVFNKKFREGLWTILPCVYLRNQKKSSASTSPFTRTAVLTSRFPRNTSEVLKAVKQPEPHQSDKKMELKHPAAEGDVCCHL